MINIGHALLNVICPSFSSQWYVEHRGAVLKIMKASGRSSVSWVIRNAQNTSFLFLRWAAVVKLGVFNLFEYDKSVIPTTNLQGLCWTPKISNSSAFGVDTRLHCAIQTMASLWVYKNRSLHDDVIKWKHFPRYWPFVRGIHWSSVNSPHKGQWRGALMFSFICSLNERLSKQSWGWWFETPSRSLWHHCNVKNLI